MDGELSRVPMYEPRAADAADAWHAVTAPGGYEWWYFDAEDANFDRQIVGILLDGFVFHPGYLRAFKRWRKHPTRSLPPVARQYPCAYLVVYEQGRIAHQFMTQYREGSLLASRQEADVLLGPNRLWIEEGHLRLQLSGTPWELTARGPRTLTGQTLEADLTFEPRSAAGAHERIFLSCRMTGEDHRWVIANPLCSVRGTISTSGAAPIAFSGRGYHDHNFGSGPLGPGLDKWMWGRVLLEQRVATFHYARPRREHLADEIHLVLGDEAGIREVPVQRVEADWSRRTALQLAYPEAVRFDETLMLSEPRVIDASPFYLRLMYEASLEGERGRAFCEVAYPHRLLWPVLGRMIEMSIDKRT